MDDTEESMPTMNAEIETDIKELIGLFDLPAFARRGQDLEITVSRLHGRCQSARNEMLDMVRLRLRQWSNAVTGPDRWSQVFHDSIEPLWTLAQAEEPRWAASNSAIKRQIAIANDLIASVVRFNHRWSQYLDRLNLQPANHVIEQYNRYYVFEKECIMGSARLAAQHFKPVPLFTLHSLLKEHPLLPLPHLRTRTSPLNSRELWPPPDVPHGQTGNHETDQ